MNITYSITKDGLAATLETGELIHSLHPFAPVFRGDEPLVEALETVRIGAYSEHPMGWLRVWDLEFGLRKAGCAYTREVRGEWVEGDLYKDPMPGGIPTPQPAENHEAE